MSDATKILTRLERAALDVEMSIDAPDLVDAALLDQMELLVRRFARDARELAAKCEESFVEGYRRQHPVSGYKGGF